MDKPKPTPTNNTIWYQSVDVPITFKYNCDELNLGPDENGNEVISTGGTIPLYPPLFYTVPENQSIGGEAVRLLQQGPQF